MEAMPAFTLPATSGGSGVLSRLGQMGRDYFLNPNGTKNWGNIIKAGSAGAGALGALTANEIEPQGPPPGWGEGTDVLPQQTFNRSRAAMPTNLKGYGKSGGEHVFFGPSESAPVTPSEALPPDLTGYVPARELNQLQYMGKAEGGPLTTTSPQFVSGGGSGRDDTVEALLSDGEYVIDAESVALLGDGSLDEGASRLDQLRSNLRKHKGAALAEGKFSPAAKDPATYMAEGGRTKNPQLGVTELPPPSSNLPAPLPNPRGEYSGPESAQQALEILARMVRPSELPDPELIRQARKIFGVGMTEEEFDQFKRAQSRGKAKGGGVRPHLVRERRSELRDSQAIREARLAALKRMLAAYQQKDHPRPGEDLGSDPYNRRPKERKAQGGVIDLAGARGRVSAIQKMAKDKPYKKAFDPVKQLTAFADRLEASLGKPEEAAVQTEIASFEPQVTAHFSKGGNVSSVLDAIKAKYGLNRQRTPEELRQMAEELRRLKPDSEILSAFDNTQRRQLQMAPPIKGVK